MWRLTASTLALFVGLLAACAPVLPLAQTPTPPTPEPAAPYVPTPASIVDEMLTLAGVGPNDVVVDLGSGDGRLVISAVTKYQARRGFGVDIDPALVKLANENAAKAGVADRVQFFERDLFVTDISAATVVTLYLLPSTMAKVETKLLAELKPGTRVVSHDYPFPTWPVTRTKELDVQEKVRISGTSFTRLLLYSK